MRAHWQLRLAASIALLAVSASGSATTVVPPTFEELVQRAEIVFESEVVATQPRIRIEPEGNPIVTAVTFRVQRVLKGKSGPTLTLDFLGGTVADRTYRVDGMPVFRVGDRDLLFAVTSERLVSPLVGLMHGRVRIVTDPGTREIVVHRFNGEPLRAVSAFGAMSSLSPLAPAPALSLAAFERAVVDEVVRQAGRGRQ